MPTFQLFKGGKMVGEVVGANIAAVETKIKQLSSGGGGASSSGGYVLGTGKKVGPQGGVNVADPNQQYIFIGLIVLLVYWWWNQRKSSGLDFDD
jgi:hypothetical protein